MPSFEETSFAKKRKTQDVQVIKRKPNARSGSKIFSPFRTLGIVTNSTPFTVTSLGQSFVIATSVGRSFHVYDASNLHLLFVSSPQTPSPITCMYSHFHYVYATWDHYIGIYKRAKLVHTLTIDQSEMAEAEGPINDIVLFGEYLAASTDSNVYVVKADSKNPTNTEIYTKISIPKVLGDIKQLVHLPTYVNKLLVVTNSNLVLYNIRSGKLIFTSDEFASQIAVVESSPVLDVVAVATQNGDVHIYNLRKGKILFTLSVDERITTMSFRTDGTPHLGLGTASGDLFFYDLNSRRRIHSVRGAHNESAGGVFRLHYLRGQPIVVSNGGDNLIQELVFDPTVTTSNKSSIISSPPRLLRSRGGHSLPPTCIAFTDENAHFILSASHDRSLWSYSLRKDSQSHEFSQKLASTDAMTGKRIAKFAGVGLGEKFPEITALAYQANKQGRWDNVVTAHKNQSFARSWSGSRGKVGRFQLNSLDGTVVKSVAITQCGNFAVIGSAGGSIAVYNLQSGALRRQIESNGRSSITGVAVDGLNRTIMSCSLDGSVQFHDFSKSGRNVHKIQLESSVTDMKLHYGSGLLGVIQDNLCITVLDTQTLKIVRRLYGHSNRITTFDFTPDGRWIVSASLDQTIRTWDLPTSGCIDAVKVQNVVTCLRISPNGEWLATSHVQGVGVQLWTQKSQFQKLSLRHIDGVNVDEEDIQEIEMPNVAGEGGANIVDGAFDEETSEDTNDITGYLSASQLSQELITLSLMPRNKFKTLTHLDAIKLRNKPIEPPKAPENAPFFLPSTTGLDGNINVTPDSQNNENGNAVDKNIPKLTSIASFETEFTELLRQRNFPAFISHIKSLSPSNTDMEIRSLNTVPPFTEMISFIDAMTFQLDSKRDYELVQAWMSMFLKTHQDVIVQAEVKDALAQSLDDWQVVQKNVANRLDDVVKYCSGVLGFIRSV